jgi:hypothetical protein
MASPAYIDAGAELDVYNEEGNASGSVLVPSGVSDGDFLLLVARNCVSTETITPPSGWTAITAHNKSSTFQSDLLLYYRVASSEPSGYTISNSGVTIQAQIFAYEAATFETSATWEGASPSTTIACPSVDSGGADRTLICVYGQYGNGTDGVTYTTPSGMTQREQNQDSAVPTASVYTSFALSDKAISASGATGTQNATASTGEPQFLAVSVLIEGSGGGGGSSIAAISNFYRMMRSS